MGLPAKKEPRHLRIYTEKNYFKFLDTYSIEDLIDFANVSYPYDTPYYNLLFTACSIWLEEIEDYIYERLDDES